MKKDKANSTASEKELKVLGVGDWMLTILVFLIPIVNIIFMAVWAFSSKEIFIGEIFHGHHYFGL